MKNHVKKYINIFGLSEDSCVKCVYCGKQGHINNGFQIHHINFRSHVFGKERDKIDNLILLCVNCHELAHQEKISKKTLIELQKNNLKKWKI